LLSQETGPVNLGNPEEISILALAQAVLRVTGSRSRIEFEPLPVDDPQRRCPDIKKAEENLGWCPSISLQQGLVRTLPYFQSLLQEGTRAPQTLVGTH
jgi:UDP-glucuronate decarboxylase